MAASNAVQLNATEVQIPNTYLRFFLRALDNDPRLLAGTGESPDSLACLGGEHSLAAYVQFLTNAEQVTGDPTIGLQLGTIEQMLSMHGPLSVALLNSPNLQDCLDIIVRFAALRNPGLQLRAVQTENYHGIEFELIAPLQRGRRLTLEIVTLAVNRLMASVANPIVRQGILEFDYPPPAYAEEYRRRFSASAIRFNTGHIRLWLPSADLLTATEIDADPQLRETAITRLQQDLQHLDSRLSTRERVALALGNNPGHLWSIAEIARHLNLAPRTLQRHLHKEGTSFQQLRDDWIMQQAHELLRQPGLSIDAIANLLGYGDVSNFRQAFRRRHGVAPGYFRKQTGNAHAPTLAPP